MENPDVKNLSLSITNAISENKSIIRYYDTNVFTLILFPNMAPADIDPVSFCRLISDIKNQGTTIAHDADMELIKEQLDQIPILDPSSFNIYGTLPGWLLFIILPIGIIYWIGYYIKINNLIDKLRIIESKLQSISFSLKAALNY